MIATAPGTSTAMPQFVRVLVLQGFSFLLIVVLFYRQSVLIGKVGDGVSAPAEAGWSCEL